MCVCVELQSLLDPVVMSRCELAGAVGGRIPSRQLLPFFRPEYISVCGLLKGTKITLKKTKRCRNVSVGKWGSA